MINGNYFYCNDQKIVILILKFDVKISVLEKLLHTINSLINEGSGLLFLSDFTPLQVQLLNNFHVCSPLLAEMRVIHSIENFLHI